MREGSQSVKLRRHLSCRLRVLKQFLCSSHLASMFGKSFSAVVCCEFEFCVRDVESLSPPYSISRCDRTRFTFDKNCQNQPIRGYTRIWYTGTHFC